MAIKAARAYTGPAQDRQVRGRLPRLLRLRRGSLGLHPGDLGQPGRARQHRLLARDAPGVLENVVVLPFNHPSRPSSASSARRRPGGGADRPDAEPGRAGAGAARFLRRLREVTRAHGIVLIFDEVISFRVGYQGAQGVLGVTPDLMTLGKIIGGGFPVGAVAGRAEVMAVFDPTRGGPPAAPHGGTFNANPVTMAAGLAAMRLLTPEAFARLDELGAKLRASLEACFRQRGRAGARHRHGLALPPAPVRPRAHRLPEHAPTSEPRPSASADGPPAHGARCADVDDRTRLPVDAHGRLRAGEPRRDLRRGPRDGAHRRDANRIESMDGPRR